MTESALRQRQNTLWPKLYALALVGLIVLVLLATEHKGTPATPTADRGDACAMSQKFVKGQLKAPTTAKFPIWSQENCRASQAGNAWVVNSFVDSQNSFGAMIRTDYTAHMTYHPDRDSWTLTGLDFASH